MGNSCFRSVGDSILVESHPHLLQQHNSREHYDCHGCKEIGFGSRYRCEMRDCRDVQYHDDCALPKSRLATHSLFSNAMRFKFHEQSPKHVKSCVACGKDVEGFRYESQRMSTFVNIFHKAIVLHPRCFNLPITTTNEGLNATDRRDELRLMNKAPSNCRICQQPKISKKIEGWAYVSISATHCFHVACVKESIQVSDGDGGSTISLKMKNRIQGVQESIERVLRNIALAIIGELISSTTVHLLLFLI